MQLPQLRRIRWAVRAALFLGVAASIAANVLHAQQNIISQTISAWPPLALLLTVELTSRIPMHRPLLATLRVTSTAVIAGIAAWVSYWHMKEVAVRYGETSVSAYLLPISVDGLIVVASVSLVELAGRIRLLEEAYIRAKEARATATGPAAAPVQYVQPAPTGVASTPAPAFQSPPATPVIPTVPTPVYAVAPATADDEIELGEDFDDEELAPLSAGGSAHGPVRLPRSAPVSPAVGPIYRNGSAPTAATRAAAATPARTMVTESTTPRPRRPVSETAQLADAIEAMQPGIGEDELAARLSISVNRLRQVRREAEAKRASLRS